MAIVRREPRVIRVGRLWLGSRAGATLVTGKLDLDTFNAESSMLPALTRAWPVLLLLAAGCSSHSHSKRAATERERDSVLGASRLPGASGVRGSIRAQDSAAARNARLDSVARQP